MTIMTIRRSVSIGVVCGWSAYEIQAQPVERPK